MALKSILYCCRAISMRYMRNICVTYAHHSLVTCRTQVSSVKCKVDAIGNVQRSMFSFVPIDRLLVSRDYPSSCFFIIEFSRACALFNFNFYRLYTWHFTEWWRLLAIGYGLLWGVKGDFLINNCLLCLYISGESSNFEHLPACGIPS